jgi:hypothetical protein
MKTVKLNQNENTMKNDLKHENGLNTTKTVKSKKNENI